MSKIDYIFWNADDLNKKVRKFEHRQKEIYFGIFMLSVLGGVSAYIGIRMVAALSEQRKKIKELEEKQKNGD